MPLNNKVRIGIVGTGFISRGLTRTIGRHPSWVVSKTLTRRSLDYCSDYPRQDLLTNSILDLIDHADLVVECSGDVIHATKVVDTAIQASLPVVTMNTEFQVTTGSYFIGRGILSEAEGDQPGSLAALNENATSMGFRPWVFGNIKGFYNPTPKMTEMRYWSQKQGISLQVVTAATDGTKIQFEQALVANGLGAEILEPGLSGLHTDNLDVDAKRLASEAKREGKPISDFLIQPKSDARVFLVAEHQSDEAATLEYLKMGSGPFYVLKGNTILTYLEIPKTIQRILAGKPPLLNNSPIPRISVAAVAKHPLKPGDVIKTGIGGFDVRGRVLKTVENLEHLPIGLISDSTIIRSVEEGQIIQFNDVELRPSLALDVWQKLRTKIQGSP